MVRASLAVCVLLAAAPSCPDLYSLATHGFTPPTVDMTTATAAPDAAGLRVNVALTALNPNPYPISLAGVDYEVAGRSLVFPRAIEQEGRLGFWRWTAMWLGVAGSYRKHETVDVVYQMAGRKRVETGLVPRPHED